MRASGEVILRFGAIGAIVSPVCGQLSWPEPDLMGLSADYEDGGAIVTARLKRRFMLDFTD